MTDGYTVTIASSGKRTAENVKVCLGILDQGKAVNIKTAAREIPVSTVLAFARRGDAIVGVGAIKRVRQKYARDRASDSGVPFDENTPEFGYIGVAEQHQGHGLSHKISAALLATNGGTLFATTDNERMKRVLRKTGFERRGREWKAKRGFLSLWIKDRGRRDLAAAVGLKGWLDYDRAKLGGLTPEQRITYFEWRVRRVVINPLERILVTEIQPTAESSALLVFGVSLCCAIEATGKFVTGDAGEKWRQFDAFITKYMSPDYTTQRPGRSTYGRVLWEHFRNGLAHGFAVCHGGFEGEAGQPYLVASVCAVDSLEINPSSFFDDFAVGFERYLVDLRNAKPAEPPMRAFNHVFKRVFIEGK